MEFYFNRTTDISHINMKFINLRRKTKQLVERKIEIEMSKLEVPLK